MRRKDDVWKYADQKRGLYADLSDRIWGMPELNYAEHRSCAEHAAMLEHEGFRVARGIAGIPTAIAAETGSGGPVIAFLGEYDALPGLSQQAGVAEHAPLEAGGSGHGCGHNLLGASGLLAAAAVRQYLEAHRLDGRVRYYGCPAEEGGSAKSFMVRAGVFDDVDVALCWHPSAFTGVLEAHSLACVEVEFRFSGRASHAAVAPELGRSALDAVELMSVGVNYLREHMPSSARVHYALVDAGGTAPNVVQATAAVRHQIRGRSLADMWSLFGRVLGIAEGAALMTETSVAWKQLSGEANLVANAALDELMFANLTALGAPDFDAADRAFADRIRETLSAEQIAAAYHGAGLTPERDEPLFTGIVPREAVPMSQGSTDVGTVSWVVPTAQCRTACYAVGTPGHSWQLVAQGKAPAAHKGMALAAKAMAGVAVDLLESPELLASAKAQHRAFRAANTFRNPIAEDSEPPLAMAAG